MEGSTVGQGDVLEGVLTYPDWTTLKPLVGMLLGLQRELET
jgi:hypothetical protein